MKPAVILHTEWSSGWGGQEMRIVSEARGVASRGHRVVIVACPECEILTHARAAGLPTRELRMRHGFDPRAIMRLCRIIRDERADIVNTHSSVDSWTGAFAAKLTGVKLVRTRHLSKPWSRHLLNFVHRMPDAIITTGAAIRQQLIEQNGLSPTTLVSVPTGVDGDDFSPRPREDVFKISLGLPPAARIITNIAVLRPWKRQDVLIDAAALLRHCSEVHVLIAGRGGLFTPGEGRLRVDLERQIERLGLHGRVRFLGHVDDVRPLLSCSDVVVSSSGSHEGVPQSLAQALAMMRPVVATDVGSTGELIIHEQTGLLVPPNDPAALAAAIDRLLCEPSFAQQCGARGRAHVLAHYSYEQMIEHVLELYERVLAVKPSTAVQHQPSPSTTS